VATCVHVSATLRAIDITKAQFEYPQPEGKLYFFARKFPSLRAKKAPWLVEAPLASQSFFVRCKR
jgi:hypothetical protein